jgi:probable rRNA maturation factor
MQVEVVSSVSGAPPAGRVRHFVGRIRSALGQSKIQNPTSKIELAVLFCGDSRMRTLNRRFRGKDKSTDVLSFPAGEGTLLGDIVVSVPFAVRQARRRGSRTSREIERLLLHGYLHLLGYDHERDDGQMDALEAKLTRRLGLRVAR